MAADPQTYVDVLEILYRILGLGFEGRYSVIEDGRRRHLEQVRHRLAALVAGARDAVPVELSPRWKPAEPGRLRALRGVPPMERGGRRGGDRVRLVRLVQVSVAHGRQRAGCAHPTAFHAGRRRLRRGSVCRSAPRTRSRAAS